MFLSEHAYCDMSYSTYFHAIFETDKACVDCQIYFLIK